MLLLALCAVQALLARPAAAIGLVDPRYQFQQIRTAHFVIYFHQGEDGLARRLASFAEAVRDEVAASLGGTAPPLTHVVLADQSEQANGWATPLPRDTVFLHAAAPSGADVIGRTDDWLRLVFTHEYTHIVHLDRSRGWARIARGLFGRTVLAYPNLSMPGWAIEGIATWNESDLTGGGRWHAGDFRAIERIATRDGRPLTLDRAGGGLAGWPDGHAPYAAGLGFHAYLAEHFGTASFGALADASARQLPFLGSRAFRRVYGRSLGALWRDYEAELAASVASGRSASTARRLTHVGNLVSGPRFAPATCAGCAPDILYSARTPETFPELRAVHADGSNDRRLATRYLGSTAGFVGGSAVFDQQEVRRGLGLYSDLYRLDRRTGEVRALTHESRLQDPDVSRDGQHVVAVREQAGRRELVRMRLDTGSVDRMRSEPDTQYSAPRWSPDGRQVVVERRVLGRLPDIVVVDASSGAIVSVLADEATRLVTPAWRPDGRAIVAAADFDQQPFDLYEFPLNDGPIRRLTRSDGATWPDISADGARLLYAGYGVDGTDVFEQPYQPMPDAVRPLREPATGSLERHTSDAGASSLAGGPAARYRPQATLAPTSWSPLVLSDADQSRLGASLFGSDVLLRHGYAVNLSWLVDGPTVSRPVAGARPDWSVSYAYARWRPTWFASASSDTQFRTAVDAGAVHRIPVAGTRRELEGGVFLPLPHVRQSAQLLASFVRADAHYRLPDRDQRSTLVSARSAIGVDRTRRYGYGISREHGVLLGTTLEMTRRSLGADASATTGTADIRAYLPGMAQHHVLALRAAAGRSQGEAAARQQFTAGQAGASPSVVDFSSSAIGLFRGDTGGALAGSQIVVGNAEYRLPLRRIERGRGTWPLLLRQVHASVFVDAVRVRGGVREDRGWARAAGAELNLDAVAGFSLPFVATLGGAWSDSPIATRAFTAYVRVGRAF